MYVYMHVNVYIHTYCIYTFYIMLLDNFTNRHGPKLTSQYFLKWQGIRRLRLAKFGNYKRRMIGTWELIILLQLSVWL